MHLVGSVCLSVCLAVSTLKLNRLTYQSKAIVCASVISGRIIADNRADMVDRLLITIQEWKSSFWQCKSVGLPQLRQVKSGTF